jgi:hypothetical protein
MSERLYALLTRIAEALEAQREPDDDTLTFPLSDFSAFAWSTIGATIVQRDADGVSIIRTANGKMAKRRSNDKFGTEVWFSYADGKAPDGTNKYHKVVEFRNVAPPEPLGRKTEQAMKAATSAGNASPLMPHLIERYRALLDELAKMGDTPPAEMVIGLDTTPPIAQTILDKLSRHVAQRRDTHRTPADPSAPPAPSMAEIDAAKAWLRDAPRANADNMGKFAKELADHMFLCGFKPPAGAFNLNAKREAFQAWLLEQVPT